MCQYALIASVMFRRTDFYPLPYSYLSKGQIPATGPKRVRQISLSHPHEKEAHTVATNFQADAEPTKIEIKLCEACNAAVHGEDEWPLDAE